MIIRAMSHFKCRNGVYPKSKVERFPVKDDAVSWFVKRYSYVPVSYESPSIRNKCWADPEIDDIDFYPKWNQLDGPVDRRSHTGAYKIVNGRPQNPVGRTGIIGRGLLGRWGPNHAADAIVTRWKRKGKEVVTNKETKLPILQFCAIQRQDNNEWAIPGGMIDPGERANQTLMREFMEEALNSLGRDARDLDEKRDAIRNFFNEDNGLHIYRGYVDDPRNTDNAWMETNAVNFHDETSEIVNKFPLAAGDDAKGVRWLDVCFDLKLYASHELFLQKVTVLRNAHF